MTIMPQDGNGEAVQVLGFVDGGAHQLAVSAVAARNAIAFGADTRVIYVYATVPCYVKFGGGAVVATASDHMVPAGVYLPLSIGGGQLAKATHLSVLQVSGPGSFHISELK